MNRLRRRVLTGFAGLMVTQTSRAQGGGLLSADEAFGITARLDGPSRVVVDFRIAPGYILYRDRFTFAADTPRVRMARPRFPPAMEKFDKVLGQRVAYFEGALSVEVDLLAASLPFRLTVQVQGCAVEAGVCYPPYVKEFLVPSSLAGEALR